MVLCGVNICPLFPGAAFCRYSVETRYSMFLGWHRKTDIECTDIKIDGYFIWSHSVPFSGAQRRRYSKNISAGQ